MAAYLTKDSIFDTLLQVVSVFLTDLRNSNFINSNPMADSRMQMFCVGA
jgi:hypothetical protein